MKIELRSEDIVEIYASVVRFKFFRCRSDLKLS